jgi:hypothetical protein
MNFIHNKITYPTGGGPTLDDIVDKILHTAKKEQEEDTSKISPINNDNKPEAHSYQEGESCGKGKKPGEDIDTRRMRTLRLKKPRAARSPKRLHLLQRRLPSPSRNATVPWASPKTLVKWLMIPKAIKSRATAKRAKGPSPSKSMPSPTTRRASQLINPRLNLLRRRDRAISRCKSQLANRLSRKSRK